MKGEIRKQMIELLDKAVLILQSREEKDIKELQKLSEIAIESVALHKNLDLISISVLIYSIYKIITTIKKQDYQDLLEELQKAKESLEENQFGKYNSSIKMLFTTIKKSDAKVKTHLHDIMHAAKIKKGTALLERGLSIGQAAGLMGLSNWDLQQYAGKTKALEQHHEKVRAKSRIALAFKIFDIK